MILYGIKNCDTVRKACRFLKQHHIDYDFVDLKQTQVSETTFLRWFALQSWETILNKRSPDLSSIVRCRKTKY